MNIIFCDSFMKHEYDDLNIYLRGIGFVIRTFGIIYDPYLKVLYETNELQEDYRVERWRRT